MSSKFDFRSSEKELMDDLSFDGPIIEQTLRELETINKWLGGNYVTVQAIKKLVASQPAKKSWRIVDLGCGSGDMLRLIAKWARNAGVEVELMGIDANPHVVNFAKNNTKDFHEITYSPTNIFSEEFAKLEADIITATLFMHHFSNEELILLFKTLKKQAGVGIAINDLHRHWFAYHSINLLTALFSRSPMVRNDAGVSVLRSFRRHELIEILKQAECQSFEIKWFWAFRWQLIIPLSQF